MVQNGAREGPKRSLEGHVSFLGRFWQIGVIFGTLWDPKKEYKFTDNRQDEIDRQMSLKTSTVSVLLPDSKSKNYLFNFADTPGHPSFSDEVAVGMRLADSVLLVVDCVEGVTFYVEQLAKEAMR